MTTAIETKEQIFELIKNVLEKDFEIPRENIRLEGQLFDDYDIDSIDAVDLIVQLKPHLGRRQLSSDAFRSVRTIQDVVDIIDKTLQQPENP